MRNKYKLIAVDDEVPSLKLIEHFVKSISSVEFVGGFNSSTSALECLEDQKVDLIVLDIDMPGINGLEVAKQLKGKAKVIFSTAHPQFAVEGFNLSATDYLLKPYTIERFKDAISKALELIDLESLKSTVNETIQIKAQYANHTVNVNSISHLESLNNNVIVHLVNGNTIVFRGALKKLIDQLPQNQFVRIHRSYIININMLSSYSKMKVNIANKELPISSAFKDDFLLKVQQ